MECNLKNGLKVNFGKEIIEHKDSLGKIEERLACRRMIATECVEQNWKPYNGRADSSI
jgi:hypothetical protein